MLTKTKIITAFILAVAFLIGCNQNKKTKEATVNNVQLVVESNNNQVANENLFANVLKEATAQKTQHFSINANEAKCIVAQKGFKIWIDPKKLCKLDGQNINLSKNLDITITELHTVEDMIAFNATTTSNGKLLQSGGSYYIAVQQNGEELKIKENKSLTIQAPNLGKKDMQLFTGIKTTDGFINWQATNQAFVTKQLDYTSSSFYNRFDKVRIGDSIGKRPAAYWECLQLYKDSTMKARWAYTIANRDKLTWKQEMTYGLQPIKFPMERYKAGIIRQYEKYYGCTVFSRIEKVGALSTMYMIADTFPIYKTVEKKMQNDATNEDRLNYYAPIETTTLGWINVDKFYDAPLCDSILFVNSNAIPFSVYRVYYKFDAINSLMGEQIHFNKTYAINQFRGSIKLPLNKAVEIVILATQNGKVYEGRKKFTVKKVNQVDLPILQKLGLKKQV